jgi:hypothetical protein
MVGLLGRVISPSQGLYLHRTTQHWKTRTKIHALSGIRTHDPSNQPAKTHASDRTATVTGTTAATSTNITTSVVAVTKLYASRSQQNRTTLQHEQRSPGEWRQLRTRSVSRLATMYCWLRATRKGEGVRPWSWSMQFGDGYYKVNAASVRHRAFVEYHYRTEQSKSCVKKCDITDNYFTCFPVLLKMNYPVPYGKERTAIY